MFAVANAGITNDLAYTNLSQYLNIPNFIDYMLINFYGANTDWRGAQLECGAASRAGVGLSLFFVGCGVDVRHRQRREHGSHWLKRAARPARFTRDCARIRSLSCSSVITPRNISFNNGPLTPGPAQARWKQRAAEIDRAIVSETARWVPGNTRDTWLNAESYVLSWFPQRAATFSINSATPACIHNSTRRCSRLRRIGAARFFSRAYKRKPFGRDLLH